MVERLLERATMVARRGAQQGLLVRRHAWVRVARIGVAGVLVTTVALAPARSAAKGPPAAAPSSSSAAAAPVPPAPSSPGAATPVPGDSPTSAAEKAGPAAKRGADQKPSTTVRPARVDPTDARIATLRIPPGFAVNVFAMGIKGACMLATGDDGTIYVSQPEAGRVLALKDTDGRGRADRQKLAASGVPGVHGLAVQHGELWLATPTDLYATQIASDGSVGAPQRLIRRLPDGTEHLNRTVGFGPDELIYVSIGSSCNACVEDDPRHAAILRISGDAKPVVFARGLRNTIGFDWHPETHELWGMDNGTDERGPDLPPEELNRIKEAADYGWPYAYGKREIDAAMDDPPAKTKEAYAAATEPSVLEYQAHSAPIAFRFYGGGQFPPEYRGDAFVAMHGSWNRDPPTGYKVVRIRFDHGTPREFEDFLSGFLSADGKETFGQPAGLTIARDGALLVSDDANGTIYRVSYGEAARAAQAPRPTINRTPMLLKRFRRPTPTPNP
jgi:glucose/arabinose dehydrogenase